MNLHEIEQQTLSHKTYGILINNEWLSAQDGRTFIVENPANEDILISVPDAGKEETLMAIDAAYTALPAWSATPAGERAAILRRVASLMMERQEHLATIMTLEQGKPIKEARSEIASGASYLAWFAGEAERLYGQIVPASTANKRLLVLRQPIGVCALITPWNFPSSMLTRKIGPAFAAGCTVICKPAEQTPLSALELGYLFIEAGLPAGVMNIIPTSNPLPFSEVIFADDRVRKISFTGSTEVGKILIRQSANTVKKLSLELGGNAPFIVFDDAHLESAVQGAILAKFRNAGQTCICANRVFVQRNIYEQFSQLFTTEVKQLKVGNGLLASSQIGPLIDVAAIEKVQRHVEDAQSKGATLLSGGRLLETSEYTSKRFWEPTVIGNATVDMLVAQEETFGPVAPLISFDSEDEVIQAANNTNYGLAAYFYSQNVGRVMRVAEKLEFGIIGANDSFPTVPQAPFGGMKQSGLGREGGSVGIDEYTEVKYVSLGI